MTALTGLKLTAAQKPTQMPPVQQRRNKLAKRLWEQAELAKAQQTGTTFAPIKFRSVKDATTGERKQVETNKRVKAWWFVADSGKLVLSVRYGTKLLELAKAQQAGSTFAPTKFRSVKDATTGERKQVETNKRVKAWWFVADNGKLVLSVRYGTKVLELAKGKWAVEVGSEKDLVPTLELLKGAVLDGELDAQIEAAANKLRDGFGG